jgi:hypothetical protein
MPGGLGLLGAALGLTAALVAAGLVIKGVEGLSCASCGRHLTEENANAHVQSHRRRKVKMKGAKPQKAREHSDWDLPTTSFWKDLG